MKGTLIAVAVAVSILFLGLYGSQFPAKEPLDDAANRRRLQSPLDALADPSAMQSKYTASIRPEPMQETAQTIQATMERARSNVLNVIQSNPPAAIVAEPSPATLVPTLKPLIRASDAPIPLPRTSERVPISLPTSVTVHPLSSLASARASPTVDTTSPIPSRRRETTRPTYFNPESLYPSFSVQPTTRTIPPSVAIPPTSMVPSTECLDCETIVPPCTCAPGPKCPGQNSMHRSTKVRCVTACVDEVHYARRRRAGWNCGVCGGAHAMDQTTSPAPSPTMSFHSTPTARARVQAHDTIPPMLLNMVVSDPIIDVSIGSGSVTVQLMVQDDRSGLKDAFIEAQRISSGYTMTCTDKFVPDTNTGSNIVSFNLTLQFARFTPAGEFSLLVRLRDHTLNSNAMDTRYLIQRGFSSTIKVVVSNDIPAPRISNFLPASPTRVDVSNGTSNITFILDIDDNGYGVTTASLNVYETMWREVSTWDDKELLTLSVPAFVQPGIFAFGLRIGDENGFIYEIRPQELNRLGFISEIEVVNTIPDTSPPKLLDLTMDLSTVHSSESFAHVTITMTVLDAMSGFWGAAVYASNGLGRTIEAYTKPIAGVLQEEFSFNLTFLCNEDYRWGIYELEVLLFDNEGNLAEISAPELTAQGFPSYFILIV